MYMSVTWKFVRTRKSGTSMGASPYNNIRLTVFYQGSSVICQRKTDTTQGTIKQ